MRQQRVNNEVMTAPGEDINQRHVLENCHSFLIFASYTNPTIYRFSTTARAMVHQKTLTEAIKEDHQEVNSLAKNQNDRT
jgi:hypothetical protein